METQKPSYPEGLIPVNGSSRIFLDAEGRVYVLEQNEWGGLELIRKCVKIEND